MFLKIPLIRGVTQFGIKGKGAPRCIGPFEIIEKVDDVAYHLNLRLQLGHLDNFSMCLYLRSICMTHHTSFLIRRSHFRLICHMKNSLQRF